MTYYEKNTISKLKNYQKSIDYGNMNISLPMYQNLKNIEVDFICKSILKAIK